MSMIRHIQFTNAEVAAFTPHQQDLKTLSDFLWNDPRPQAEGKFEMRWVATGWDDFTDDAHEALSRCGTAACACGWAPIAIRKKRFFSTSERIDGLRPNDWMFGGHWIVSDNTPFGAAYRIDHWLKHQSPDLYVGDLPNLMARHYPKPAPWLEAA